ncbi:MAG: hypothetical protein DMG58_29965 [Acidobacteria bacterium]|nr:MAG: hypothetical protein DMG58_29965 [Acidobacteriota bacterium]
MLAACTALAVAADKEEKPPAANTSQEISELRAMLADQQRQIAELRQKNLINSRQAGSTEAQGPASVQQTSPGIPQLGQVASTTPVIPVAPAVRAPLALPLPARVAGAQESATQQEAPLQLHIGSAAITPVGFMDFTAVLRSTNPGSGIGTNFGSIPYNTGVNGKISEFRLSAQNSRIGLRVDAKAHGTNVLGYLESDFLGFLPTNAAVTSNSDSLRLRLYWVDVRKDKVELFAGQSWSMLTPNRKGLSALPSDLFYTQVIDVNYQNGLVWSPPRRSPWDCPSKIRSSTLEVPAAAAW